MAEWWDFVWWLVTGIYGAIANLVFLSSGVVVALMAVVAPIAALYILCGVVISASNKRRWKQ